MLRVKKFGRDQKANLFGRQTYCYCRRSETMTSPKCVTFLSFRFHQRFFVWVIFFLFSTNIFLVHGVHYKTFTDEHRSRGNITPEMSAVLTKLVRFTPNTTNLQLLWLSVESYWPQMGQMWDLLRSVSTKMYWNWSIVPFGANLTQFGANPDIPDLYCMLFQLYIDQLWRTGMSNLPYKLGQIGLKLKTRRAKMYWKWY